MERSNRRSSTYNTRQKCYRDVTTTISKRVISFEDNGTGNKFADLLVNELNYDITLNKNFLYGYKYFILRKEFFLRKKINFHFKVKSILITFGGTDPSNYTLKVINLLNKYILNFRIKTYLVIGPGYKNKKGLTNRLKKIKNDFIILNQSVGKMSSIMSKVDIAISSNGRTVLELAHMNIPGIIIDQNKRESNHVFWKISNGFYNFINLSSHNKQNFIDKFVSLINDNKKRKKMYINLKKYNFKNNEKLLSLKLNNFINEK